MYSVNKNGSSNKRTATNSLAIRVFQSAKTSSKVTWSARPNVRSRSDQWSPPISRGRPDQCPGNQSLVFTAHLHNSVTNPFSLFNGEHDVNVQNRIRRTGC